MVDSGANLRRKMVSVKRKNAIGNQPHHYAKALPKEQLTFPKHVETKISREIERVNRMDEEFAERMRRLSKMRDDE